MSEENLTESELELLERADTEPCPPPDPEPFAWVNVELRRPVLERLRQHEFVLRSIRSIGFRE